MILYYSATGNSKHVADSFQQAFGGTCISIIERMHNGDLHFYLQPEEWLIIISPTYYWGAPAMVTRFLQQVEITGNTEERTVFIATYGTSTGSICSDARKILSSRGIPVGHCCDVKMVDTWTPIFDLSDPVKVATTNRKAEFQIAQLIKCLQEGVPVASKEHLPKLFTLAYHALYEHDRTTDKFTVNRDLCIGCGKCVKVCTDRIISLKDGYPVWNAEKCNICLACLHHCPRFAIQRGRNTRKHGQYIYKKPM